MAKAGKLFSKGPDGKHWRFHGSMQSQLLLFRSALCSTKGAMKPCSSSKVLNNATLHTSPKLRRST